MKSGSAAIRKFLQIARWPAVLLLAGSPAIGAELTVGVGKTYAQPSQAARAARSGDVVRIFAGTYSDCTRWDANGLVIEGIGPDVVISGKVCDDKGMFITRGNDIAIRNITFTGARASHHNGAAIRVEGANLSIENSRFIDNENGILTAPNAASAIIIKNSTFRGNGNCIEACAHGIYAGHIAELRIENSTFEAQHVGHHIKSRAAHTEIVNNSVRDGVTGSASYLVDLPNGGSAVISGNLFEKGPRSSNRQTAISVAGETETNPPGEIRVEDNRFFNETGIASTFVRNYTTRPITLLRNQFSGDVMPVGAPLASKGEAAKP